MTTFWSCHLIVNKKNPDDCRYVRDFIDAGFLRWGGISTLFLKWTPSTNANIYSHYYAPFAKMLNISTANDSTLTVGVSTVGVVLLTWCLTNKQI